MSMIRKKGALGSGDRFSNKIMLKQIPLQKCNETPDETSGRPARSL